MKIPQDLGMQHGWIYEVVAGTRSEDGPHAAPIGVMTPDGRIIKAELYKGSTTLENILRNSLLGLNLPPDATMLQTALYHRQELRYVTSPTGSDVPFVMGADAWLELRVTSTRESTNKILLEAELSGCHIQRPVKLLNRAHGLLLESLVLSTRRHLLDPQFVRDQLLENARVISKVAPGSTYAASMGDLLQRIGIKS